MRLLKNTYKNILVNWVKPIFEWAKKVTIPGFDNTPLYDVGLFFFKGIKNGAIETRAAAVAFNLFIALFPTMIFIFTLIPIIPIKNFQTELLLMIQSVVPESTYASVHKTIEEIIIIPHGGLLSFGFILALYFSTNGIVSLIQAFNASVNATDSRSWLALRFISLILVIIMALMVTTGITLITFTQTVLHFLVKEHIMQQNFTYYLVTLGKWIVILALFYFAYSFLYYLGPARKSKWRFISAGGTLATFLSIIITLGFGFYIDHFGKYNALYGSIGTLPVIMLMVYFNCLSVIIGFELNIGIVAARRMNKNNGAAVTIVETTLQQPLSTGPEFIGNKSQ
jgi:membrane protein